MNKRKLVNYLDLDELYLSKVNIYGRVYVQLTINIFNNVFVGGILEIDRCKHTKNHYLEMASLETKGSKISL